MLWKAKLLAERLKSAFDLGKSRSGKVYFNDKKYCFCLHILYYYCCNLWHCYCHHGVQKINNLSPFHYLATQGIPDLRKLLLCKLKKKDFPNFVTQCEKLLTFISTKVLTTKMICERQVTSSWHKHKNWNRWDFQRKTGLLFRNYLLHCGVFFMIIVHWDFE